LVDRYIARQPIFNNRLGVFGYELLCRSGPKNIFEYQVEASTSVIVDSTMLFDLQALTGNAKAFVNIDLGALQRRAAFLLPPDRVVLEILETVSGTPEVIQACRDLSAAGYALALDDVISVEKLGPLLDIAHFLKMDFRGTDMDARRSIADCSRSRRLSLVAEKVETQREVEDARNLGCSHFQGFFFCKPAILSQRGIPGNKLHYLRLLEASTEEELQIDKVEAILKQDPSLTYKLLRYLNSPILGLRCEIRDIRHAISLLGETEFRRWVSVVAITGMANDKPSELVRTALARACFCEQIAALIGLANRKSELFLFGLLTILDALLDLPMEQAITRLPLNEEVRLALLGEPGTLRDVRDLLLSYERGNWQNVTDTAARLKLTEDSVAENYLSAVNRADSIVKRQTGN